MKIGIVCYASMGGSGIVATELGKALADRGHQVHIISADQPFRLSTFHPGLVFHQVNTPSYPLFREPQYVIGLANTIVQVGREQGLDIIHAHYAVPHATAAVLARQVLEGSHKGHVPRVVTTLHGTDITVIGADPSYSEIVAFSIDQSDGVTAVSESLRAATCRELSVHRSIDVIPNFLDCNTYCRVPVGQLRQRYAEDDTRIVMHLSNFRPVKRIDSVVEVFARIARSVPSVLLLAGDGPELPTARRVARQLGVADRVQLLGVQENVLPLLSIADLFLLPSEQESFGLAALEAMACGVPVVGTAAGGLPEVVEEGKQGFLRKVGDVDGMAEAALGLLRDDARWKRFSAACRLRAEREFPTEALVARYRAIYEATLSE
jgi:N-acetyl-alpha-D-glucosaminyl L-malate synthase BshA